MREDIESLIVQVEPAGETSSSGIGHWSVAIQDILVVLIPPRNLVIREE